MHAINREECDRRVIIICFETMWSLCHEINS